MIDMYGFLVEQVFGGFWISIFAMAGIFMIMLMLGGVSMYTIMWYDLYFIFMMAIGYGQPFISIIGSTIIIYVLYQSIKGWIERGGGQ